MVRGQASGVPTYSESYYWATFCSRTGWVSQEDLTDKEDIDAADKSSVILRK